MSASAANLIQRTRRYLRDWPDGDSLTASVGSSDTTITVADSSIYAANWPIEIDNEAMIVRSKPTATTVAVKRGAFGSTAATHTNGTSILVRPAFLTVEILDAINAGIQACYPMIYQSVLDTSLTITTGAYEYTLPNMPGTYGGDTIPIPRVHLVELRQASDVPYFPLRAWNIRRGATPILKLTYLESAGSTLRIHGYGPFPDLALADSLHAQWPKNFTDPLGMYAAATLLAAGEGGRSRVDVGARDDREAANRPGVALQTSLQLEQRFQRRLATVAFPPMQPHIVTSE